MHCPHCFWTGAAIGFLALPLVFSALFVLALLVGKDGRWFHDGVRR